MWEVDSGFRCPKGVTRFMNKPRILLVEDDERDYDPLVYFLEQSGFEVVGAKNADDGIRSMDQTIDLAVVDILIPIDSKFGSYGVRVCGEIKRKYPSTPVIVFTNWADISEFIKGCDQAGADEIIYKKRSTFYLIERIIEQLKKYGKLANATEGG